MFTAVTPSHTVTITPSLPVAPLQIVSRYDIIVILEVVDISGESVKILLDALNE